MTEERARTDAKIMTIFTQADPPGAHAIRWARTEALAWLDEYAESWGTSSRPEEKERTR
jgi:hypothetical protein